MLKSILTIIVILFSSICFAGNTPAAVQKAFEQKFPNATGVKWDKENAHEYEASFVWKGVKYSANFSDSGDWLETEYVSAFNEMPDKVQAAFNASHKGATVHAVAKIETSKGITNYEIEFKRGMKIIEILYSEDGTEVKNR